MFKSKGKDRRLLNQLAFNTDWKQLSKRKLSIEFIEEFADKLDWDELTKNNTFEESFIRKHIDRFNMFILACYQRLSETFIREYADNEVFLKGAISHQTYTVNFAREHIKQFCEYLHKDFFRENTLPQEKFFEEFKDSVNWWYLNKNSKLTPKLIEKYFQKFNFSSNDMDFYKIDKDHYKAIREGGWSKSKKERHYGVVTCGSGLTYANSATVYLDPDFTLLKKADLDQE